MKKRGLSTIIATLLIVLLILVATGIVWVAIKSIITKNAENISLGKFTVDLEINSVKKTDVNVNIKVKRNPGEGELKGITFVVFDGQNNYVFEKTNITLKPLEIKTFVVDYTGEVVSVSIAPMFESNSGKLITGSISDTYYINAADEEYIPTNCTPSCAGKECGDDGCGNTCGECSGNEPNCVLGTCVSSEEPCEANCTCAGQTCVGQTCSDGCSGSCPGQLTLEIDCGSLMCGDSPHGCGVCAECDTGYYCDGGICVVSCVPDCGIRECGAVPNGCGTSCGTCNSTAGEWCDNGFCSSESCTPDCGIRNCGAVPNGCGTSCGTCNSTAGEYCGEEGICITEESLNSGTVYSVWPLGIGIYFDSPDLPKSGVSYTNYYTKFLTGTEARCLQIRDFVTPVVPEIYNMSYIRFVTSFTEVGAGDIYEIWETYQGCISS